MKIRDLWKQKYDELCKEYANGRFPKESLKFIKEQKDFGKDELVFIEKDNFLHLTGVTTSLSPSSFFDKCLNGSLEEDDFDLTSHGQDEKASKGSIRRKIKSLPYIGGLISASSYVEEDFRKNSVFCSIASSDGSCTMGFIAVPKARPKTLLIGNELDSAKAQPLKIILMKSRSDTLFDTVIAGNDNDLVSNYELIKTHIDAALNSRILSAYALLNCERSGNLRLLQLQTGSYHLYSY